MITLKERLKGDELVASKVRGSQILFGPIRTELMDFPRTSLTNGGSGERGRDFEANILLFLKYLSHC